MRFLLTMIMLLALTSTAWGKWSLALTVEAETASTSVLFGVENNASNGFDAGQDTPARPYEDDALFASFPHPEWGVVIGGEAAYGYLRDIRGSLPQTYELEVISLVGPVTLSWSSKDLPNKTSLQINNPYSGESVDMTQTTSYQFNPGGPSPTRLTITASPGDTTSPSSPSGVALEERVDSLFISWLANNESDLAGYKVHFGSNSDDYSRIIDVRNVTNYSLFNLNAQDTWYVAVSAYDKDGNESAVSTEVSGGYQGDTAPPVISGLPGNLVATARPRSNNTKVRWKAPTASDAVDGSVALVVTSSPTADLQSGSTFPLGITTMTYVATDSSGNTATESFTVTVEARESKNERRPGGNK